MHVRWDPAQYNRFTDHRGRPFVDLIGRVGAERPRRVVDLGCGPGNLTALLAHRWPEAQVEGIDSSPDMIEAARRSDTRLPAAGAAFPPQSRAISYIVGDVRDWRPSGDVDVLVSNATLQWVPEHRELLSGWAERLPSGAWLAFQVPGNYSCPSHVLMRELAESPRWATALRRVLHHDRSVEDPLGYARLLLDAGWYADAWETTYIHVLIGTDPVIEWMRGTGLRPVLQALSPDDAIAYEQEYAARLRVAYPATPAGTLFPFRRVFAVGHKP